MYHHPPTDEEKANFGHVIESYYAFIDGAVGQLVAEAPADATVMVVADHGMHSFNLAQTFDPNDPPSNINSGHHNDAPPGVFIAAGHDIRVDSSVDPGRPDLKPQDLPVVGRVLDITPTLLVLKGIPVGADMDGTVLDKVVTPEFLREHPPAQRRTHDTEEWRAARQTNRHDAAAAAAAEVERVKQLRALGYVQ
jgi:arylsulfatase A-like enzyme